MDNVILTLHILACIFLIIIVLLQSGKEGMGVIFGGGNSSVFGSSGAGGVLVRLTTILAIIFLCTSLGYNIVTTKGGSKDSIIKSVDISKVEAQAKPAESSTPAANQPETTSEPQSTPDAPKATDAPVSSTANPNNTVAPAESVPAQAQ